MAFYDQIDDATNFVISFTPNPQVDFGVFAKGYTLAANRMTGLLLEAPRFSDHEAYPVVFLYRHALELSLKHIIYGAAELAAFRYLDELEQGLQNTHELPKLALVVSKALALLFPKDLSLLQVAANVSDTCNDFANIDPRSDAYRYPIDKHGRHSTKTHQVVNLRAISNRMSSVLEDLDTIQFGLQISTDAAQMIYKEIEELVRSVYRDDEKA